MTEQATTPASTPDPTIDPSAVEAFAFQVGTDLGAALGVLLAHLGDQLGLWRELSRSGQTTPDQLAAATGTNERMIREWLSAQAAAGYVIYDPATSQFELPAEHAMVLAEEQSPAFLGGGFQMVTGVYQRPDDALAALRTGKGLGWADHHHDMFEGVERTFRPTYEAALTTQWIPSLDGIERRLADGGRVADVGCGHGASTVVMAEAYPEATVVGCDKHPDSIEVARARAAERDLGDRITFDVASATDLAGDAYDLITYLDCLHDMADPLGAVRHAATVLAPGGSVVVVEPFATDRLEDNLNPVGRLYYSGSTLVCTPSSLAEDGAALGAQAGEARLRSIFEHAGYGSFRRVAETPLHIVYEARL